MFPGEEIIHSLLCAPQSGLKEKFGALLLENGLWEEFIELGMHKHQRIAFRSAWALSWAFSQNKQAILPYFGKLTDTFIASSNGSVHREYSKIIYYILHQYLLGSKATKKESQLNGYGNEEPIRQEAIAEKCFDLLLNPDTKIAVKVWMMDILSLLCRSHEWIAEHLPEIIRQQIEEAPSPGLESRARKVLRRLKIQ